MRIDIDTYREILDTITRNKSRSFLTGFGVFWGVFMLVTLIGGGRGLKEMLSNNFSGFATNMAMLWANETTKPYKGFSKGRTWNMDLDDVGRLREHIPELDVVTPLLFSNQGTLVYADKTTTGGIQGIYPDYAKVCEPKIVYGRYINEMDMKQGRKVCVIGKKIYKDLFPGGGDPCGKCVRLDSTYYQVVGVDYRASNSVQFGGRAEEQVLLPQSVLRQVYNRGNDVDLMAVTARKGVVMNSVTDKMRQTIARQHMIAPDDEQGLTVFNTEVLFGMLNNLFQGVNILIWLVGIGTLLAGAIGVSNIMMVTVKERTTEIGIRRAIGATPRVILSQIIAESIVLTGVAGMSGIMMAVAILQMLEMGNTHDGIITTHFQVDFWTAILAALLLALLGGLAGLAPAWRAMNIKPVDAMRDE